LIPIKAPQEDQSTTKALHSTTNNNILRLHLRLNRTMRIIFSNLLRYLVIVFFCFYSSPALAQLTLSRPDVPEYQKQISGTGLSNKGLIAATGYYDGSIYLWETATGKLIQVIENCYKPERYG
jgi:hypothetical protein